MTDVERAYLAGIIDGEGCLGVGTRLGKYITPTLQVSNTKLALLTWIQTRWGGSIYQHRERENRNQCYLWSLAGQKALAVIRDVRPYLVIKDEHADLLLSIPRATNKLAPEQKERNLEIAGRIHVLNKRGTA